MDARLVITEYRNLIMGFLFEDNSLYEVHSFDENNYLGQICVARVENLVSNLDAAFVSVSPEENCYYSLTENKNRHIPLSTKKQNKISEGDLLLVQVSGESIRNKKMKATADLTLAGNYVVVNRTGTVGVSSKIKEEEKRSALKELVSSTILEQSDMENGHFGAVVRTRSKDAAPEEITKETIKLLCKLKEIIHLSRYRNAHSVLYKNEAGYIRLIRQELLSRYENLEVVTDIPSVYDTLSSIMKEEEKAFSNAKLNFYQDKLTSLLNIYRIEKQMEIILSRKVYLKSGGYLVVDLTEAMAVIDVNTGKSIQGSNREAHILKINKEAAKKAADILRLRNLSGMILIDFINMESKKAVQELIAYLKTEIAKDSVKTNFIDVTGLGLVELTRKKVRRPLHEVFYKKNIDSQSY